MAIIINLERHVGERKMSVTDVAEKVGTPMASISVLKNSKAL
jgi:DNA-binding Xre family transcriptional regulator